MRALGLAISAKPLPDAAQTVRLAEHVLNNFDIPLGFIRSTAGDTTPMEFTQWSTIADLKGKSYFVKTYDNQVLRRIDLMSFDLDAKAIRTAPLKPTEAVPALGFQKP